MSAADAFPAELLRDILNHVAQPIFVKDRECRFVLVNQALCQIVRLHEHELLGKTDYDFFPREQADFFREKDLATLAGERVYVEEELLTDSTGAVHVLAHGAAMAGDGGPRSRDVVRFLAWRRARRRTRSA